MWGRGPSFLAHPAAPWGHNGTDMHSLVPVEKRLLEGRQRRQKANSRNTSRKQGRFFFSGLTLMPLKPWKLILQPQKSHGVGNTMTQDREGEGDSGWGWNGAEWNLG